MREPRSLIGVWYGYARLETVSRQLPDGSVVLGTRARVYNHQPGEQPNLVTDKTTWTTHRVLTP